MSFNTFSFKAASIFFILIFLSFTVAAQEKFLPEKKLPSPQGALLRSFILPGWGHHYTDKTNWTRGQIHLAADVVMLAAYIGLQVRVNDLEGDMRTIVRSKAQTSLSGKSRQFELAVANFNSQAEYNDFQRRSRNLALLLEGESNFWEWETVSDRQKFRDVRNRAEDADNQLPAIIGLMVANRVVSGISAFVRARKQWEGMPQIGLSYLRPDGQQGLTASMRFTF